MSNKQAGYVHLSPRPLHAISLVTKKETIQLSPESVKVELVGEKAFGLSCLPEAWTLPFVVVSGELSSLYEKSHETKRKQLLKRWCKQIIPAALLAGIKNQDAIIVRSSGYSEGLEERGKFYSEEGTLSNIVESLSVCLKKLVSDRELNQREMPLVIQRYAIPISAKGHLSNERRWYKENRDWLGEFEDVTMNTRKPFQINLRNWREKIITGKRVDTSLECILSAHVSETLKIPATWVYEQGLRVHFEWIWDGKTIYLVQADQEHETKGVNPTQVYNSKVDLSHTFKPKCLNEVKQQHAKKYGKIRNVFTYRKLGLPTTKFYVLDDQSVIDNLACGKVSSSLKTDVLDMIKRSLVIRMDIATEDVGKKQLLPRTEEVREIDGALKWLKEKSAEIRRGGIREDLAFIFHNFVPAVSSAFALAVPGERKVQIEALWGLPEGLYYNAHDKYIVDTKTPQATELQHDKIGQFEISKKLNFKCFFVAPDGDGHWTSKILEPPYDWKSSIPQQQWIREIALESRRIAHEEKSPLSIMWLINVLGENWPRKILPWYHERYDPKQARTQTHRTKTPFDKSLIIKTNDDIAKLRHEAMKELSDVRRIRIQPCEDELLRNKDTLRVIGELSKKIDAVILLEGGVLSHAYYQLMQTDAIVEVSHPFRDIEDKHEFNKLVRDKVSSNIEEGGEIVRSSRLLGEALLRALREKLVEESFEVLDAVDKDSIVVELADASEIMDAILAHIDVTKSELETKRKQKRAKAGGFKDGIVLLETQNPLPTQTGSDVVNALFDDSGGISTQEHISIGDQMIIELGHKMEKVSDKRKHPAATEVILRLTIPMSRDNWTANAPETIINQDSGDSVRAKITGVRLGSRLQIELSIFTHQEQDPKQLDLWDQG